MIKYSGAVAKWSKVLLVRENKQKLRIKCNYKYLTPWEDKWSLFILTDAEHSCHPTRQPTLAYSGVIVNLNKLPNYI